MERSNTKAVRRARGSVRLLLWGLLLFGFQRPRAAIAGIAAALIHEAAHALALRRIGKRRFRLRTVGNGLKMTPDTLLTYREERRLAAAGPLANLFCAALTPLFFHAIGVRDAVFPAVSLLTALVNLLPVRGYDGGRILGTLIAQRWGDRSAFFVLRFLGTAVCVFLTFFFLYTVYRFNEGYWCFFVFLLTGIKEVGGNE